MTQAFSMLLFMVIFGHISGGHFNPAITIGVFIGGGIRAVLAIFYLICQFFGAFIGAVIVRVGQKKITQVYSNTFFKMCLNLELYEKIHGGTTVVEAESVSRAQAIFIELLITYVVVTAYLLTCVDTDGKCGVDGALGVGVSAPTGKFLKENSTDQAATQR
jgi:glycerol uptake facilitator-like aquaporin